MQSEIYQQKVVQLAITTQVLWEFTQITDQLVHKAKVTEKKEKQIEISRFNADLKSCFRI